MKEMLMKLKEATVKGFTLVEMRDTKTLYILHLMTMLSAVTCTFLIKALTMAF